MQQITLKYNDGAKKKVNIPECWQDVTVRQFIDFINIQRNGEYDYALALISIMLNIPADEVEQLPLPAVEYILGLLSFTMTQGLNEQVPEKYKTFDIHDIAWKHLLHVELQVSNIQKKYPSPIEDDEQDEYKDQRSKALIALLPLMCKEFLNEDISDKPITDWYWAFGFFLIQLKHLRKDTLNGLKTKKLKRVEFTMN